MDVGTLIYPLLTIILGGVIYYFFYHKQQDSEGQDGGEGRERLTSGGGDLRKGSKDVKKDKGKGKGNLIRSSKPSESSTDFSHPWLQSTLKGHSGPIRSLDLSSNGHLLASAASDRTVLIWVTKTFKEKDHKHIRVNIEFDSASCVHWSPDNKAFLVANEEQKFIEVFKLGKKPDGSIGNIQSTLKFPKAHDQEIIGLGIDCAGKFIMSCSKDSKMAIWDLKGSILEETFVSPDHGTTFGAKVSPCGRYVGACGLHSTPDLVIYKAEWEKHTTTTKYRGLKSHFKLPGHKGGVYSFDFNTDSTKIATLSVEGTWQLFDTTGNRIDVRRSGVSTTFESLILKGKSHQIVPVIALSHDCRIILLGIGTSIEVFSGITGNHLANLQDVHKEPVRSLAFSLDDKTFMSSGDRFIYVFSNVSGYEEKIRDLRELVNDKSTGQALKSRLMKELLFVEDEFQLLK